MCKTKLIKEAVPREVVITEKLPETMYFKVDTTSLENKYQQREKVLQLNKKYLKEYKMKKLIIGIDADGVLTDMYNFNKINGMKIFKRPPKKMKTDMTLMRCLNAIKRNS